MNDPLPTNHPRGHILLEEQYLLCLDLELSDISLTPLLGVWPFWNLMCLLLHASPLGRCLPCISGPTSSLSSMITWHLHLDNLNQICSMLDLIFFLQTKRSFVPTPTNIIIRHLLPVKSPEFIPDLSLQSLHPIHYRVLLILLANISSAFMSLHLSLHGSQRDLSKCKFDIISSLCLKSSNGFPPPFTWQKPKCLTGAISPLSWSCLFLICFPTS